MLKRVFLGHRNRSDEPMTLKDFLAEGGQSPRRREQLNNMDSLSSSGSSPMPGLNLTKSQQRSLQEAMYYAAETGHLDIAVDLRNLGKSIGNLLRDHRFKGQIECLCAFCINAFIDSQFGRICKREIQLQACHGMRIPGRNVSRPHMSRNEGRRCRRCWPTSAPVWRTN